MVGCSILGCKSRSERKIDEVSFHSFPFNAKTKKTWDDATGRYNWVPKKCSKICSIHFYTDTFINQKNRVLLKPLSVPQKNIHVPGLWYAYESLGYDSSISCPTVYVELKDGIQIYQESYIEDGNPRDVRGVIEIKDGKVWQTFFSEREPDLHSYVVLDTDDSVASAALYYCGQVTPTTKEVVSWKFSKVPEVSQEVRDRIDATVRQYPELESAKWRKYDHSNCQHDVI